MSRSVQSIDLFIDKYTPQDGGCESQGLYLPLL